MAGKGEEEAVCPVDHSTREVWLQQAGKRRQEYHDTKIEPKPNDTTAAAEADKCPVDHASREVWLKQAKKSPSAVSSNGGESFDLPPTSAVSNKDCSSDRLDSGALLSNASTVAAATGLSNDREVSTIPRSGGSGGNWVYPSQAQFFSAMKRKNWDARAEDMEAVVPIHNAVNERAWGEILKWEEPRAASTASSVGLLQRLFGGAPGAYECGGPQLVRFSGDASKVSPRARFKMTVFGWQRPFDRHDWVVDRCGKETVEYVIDFYAGKANPNMPGLPSFYLDVRPKLNSVEGCRMRFMKWVGLL